MLMERNEIVKTLREEFKEQLEIEREIVSSRRRFDIYPPHVCKLLIAGTRVPFIVMDGQLVLEGEFSSLKDCARAQTRKRKWKENILKVI